MSKKSIFINELFKVLLIVLLGLGVIFPFMSAFTQGFKDGFIETYVNLYSSTSTMSFIGLIAIVILIAVRRTWAKVNLNKAENDK